MRWSLASVSRRNVLAGALAGTLALVVRRIGPSPVRAEERGAGALPARSDGEVATLTRFAEVLIPSSFSAPDGTGRGAAVIRSILDRHATDGEFRAAAELLDRASVARHGVPFAALDPAGRRELVAALLTPYAQRSLYANLYYYLSEDGRRIRKLWESVSKPIIANFYLSQAGWEVVGYPRRPGQCANLTDYQEPPVA